MSEKSEISVISYPFLDEVFLNSPLCQICEFANYGVGGVCSLLLNRRIPINIIIKDSKVVSCSAHRNWIENFEMKEKNRSEKKILDKKLRNSDILDEEQS